MKWKKEGDIWRRYILNAWRHSRHISQALKMEGSHFVTKVFSIYLSSFTFPFTFEYKKDDYVKARKYSETCIICHCCCKMLQAYLSFKTPFHFSFIFLSQSVNIWKWYYQAFVYFNFYEFISYIHFWLKF